MRIGIIVVRRETSGDQNIYPYHARRYPNSGDKTAKRASSAQSSAADNDANVDFLDAVFINEPYEKMYSVILSV